MNVLIAPDKFKGSLSAKEVCLAVEKGIKKYDSLINTLKHPLADGGEGTLEILKNYFSLTTISTNVKDPLFRTITAKYMVSETTAYIEMSNASGLQLLRKVDQNCFNTTSFGTGELILDAIDKGFNNIVLFIGGSATNDAGIGMAAALGYEFYNSNNQLIKPIGKELINIDCIKTTSVNSKLKNVNFKVICDVKNPLYGKNGAAHVYAEQKGASLQEIKQLDLGLQNFAGQVEKYLHKSVALIGGSGAAGGMGAGTLSFLNAALISGIDFVMEQTNIKKCFKHPVDLIITGEGSVDKQTLEGKVVKGIANLAEKTNTPFCIISGIAKDKKIIQENLKPLSIHPIMDLNITQQESILNAATYIENISYSIIKKYHKKLNTN